MLRCAFSKSIFQRQPLRQHIEPSRDPIGGANGGGKAVLDGELVHIIAVWRKGARDFFLAPDAALGCFIETSVRSLLARFTALYRKNEPPLLSHAPLLAFKPRSSAASVETAWIGNSSWTSAEEDVCATFLQLPNHAPC